MRPGRYAIDVTLDGCGHHEAGRAPDEESISWWTAETARADALLLGRVTYRMMESAWRRPSTGTWPAWMGPLGGVDWHAELVRGDLAQPVLAGPGPTLLSGLRERIELELVDRHDLRSGARALRYRPMSATA